MAPALSAPLDSFRWYQGSAEQRGLFWICTGLIAQFGVAAGVLLCGINAPYGRYNQQDEKATRKNPILKALGSCDIHPKVAWVVQESPTLIAAAACWLVGSKECKENPGNIVALGCFVIHYINRAILYPLRMKGSKPIPLPVMLMATAFCAANGYIQSRCLTRFTVVPTWSWTLPAGVALWIAGFGINAQADDILRNLRKPGETGYKIPMGGFFEYVSGANFFGEIVEWSGYGLAMGGALPGLTFAFCSACNIGPRALAHHQWYLSKFKDSYPRNRKALIPFLL
jgi:3-oxo-5-alpha-steroid 4-dehydrogenase 1